VLFGHSATMNGRKIGSNVLIGMNATILHDVEIGSSCIIGAGCLVMQGIKSLIIHLWSVPPEKLKDSPLSSNYGWYKRELKNRLGWPGIKKSKACSPIVIKL